MFLPLDSFTTLLIRSSFIKAVTFMLLKFKFYRNKYTINISYIQYYLNNFQFPEPFNNYSIKDNQPSPPLSLRYGGQRKLWWTKKGKRQMGKDKRQKEKDKRENAIYLQYQQSAQL